MFIFGVGDIGDTIILEVTHGVDSEILRQRLSVDG